MGHRDGTQGQDTGDNPAGSDRGRGSWSSLLLPSWLSRTVGPEEHFAISTAPEQLQELPKAPSPKACSCQDGKAGLGRLEEAALTRVYQGRAEKCISTITRNILPFSG